MLALSVATLLTGCAQAPVSSRGKAPAQPLSRIDLPQPSPQRDVRAQLISGEFALADGDVDAAAQAYGRAAALSPDPRVSERAVGLALASGDNAGAQRAIGHWQSQGGDPQALTQAQAQLALSKGHREQAARELEKLIAPGTREAWGAFGRVLAGARDPALAGVLLEQLATPQRLPAEDGDVWIAMSQLGEKLSRHAYAATIAQAAADRFRSANAYVWAGQMQIKSGHRKQAKALLANAVAQKPKDIRLRLAYAALLGDLDENVQAARVLAQGPQSSETYMGRTAYAARADDKAELERVYGDLRKARPQVREDNLFLLGQLAELLQHDRQALAWYQKVPSDDEHAFEAEVRTAVLLDGMGRHKDAIAMAHQLQRDYADQAEQARRAVQLEAELAVRAHDQAGAVAAYSRALDRFPDDPELLYGRALSEADAGDNEAAVRDLRQVLKLKPDDVDAMNALGYTLADAGRHLDESERLLRKALKAKPEEPAIMDSWGWLQYRLGHLQQAEEQLRKAWNKGKDPEIGVHLGEVLWQQGKHTQAKRIFAAVRKLDPHNALLKQTTQRLQR